MIHFPLCPLIPHAHTFPPWYLSPFVLPSSSQPTYISLVCHVCLFSSYINFYSTLLSFSICMQLKSSTSQYFWPPETVQLSYLCYSTLCSTGNFPTAPTDSTTSLRPMGHTYTCIYSKYLDHDRRLAQCMSWSHCPYPPLHLKTYETQSSHRVA